MRRVGRKKQASFRIVVAGSMHANSGRISETIGKYNPRTSPSHIEVDEARALHWLREGAELSESVRPLFRKVGLLRKFAEGEEGEGVVAQGDPQGKTVLATRPTAARMGQVTEEEPAKAEKHPKPKAEKAAKVDEAEEEAEAEAKAEKAEQPEAKLKEEGTEAEEPEVKAETGAAEAEEAEAKPEKKPKAKARKPKAKAKKSKAKKGEGEAEAESGEEDEEEKDE